MTIYGFYQKADEWLKQHPYDSLNRSKKIQHKLIEDIVSTLYPKKSKNVFRESISKIRLKGNYSRKLVVQVFSAFDGKVTRYIREYGRTIVHFEDASDSES